MEENPRYPKHLAWHETLELHELVSFQSGQLISFKKKLPSIHDPALKSLYAEAIRSIENNLHELLRFYPQAPVADHRDKDDVEPLAAESGQLLGFSKTAVRNYATAITETATPKLKMTFVKHLHGAIALHGKVFAFMYERGYYPAYDLKQLLAGDMANAQKALKL
ncbi:spore coat protein [Paenibacillus chartarius]|uniref:Spore coat protein n=1 Tax=Paenibacillus chartarius TaxID=747481 RepID=A0ABV6DIR0_9BACL